VQQYPELFDGVLAGAPAFNFLGHGTWFGHAYEILGFKDIGTMLISFEQWAMVQKEVLNQCDALDGASDGILEDPSTCKFDWGPLMCTANSTSSSSCFSPEQVEGAARLFAPITYNSTVLHPGHFHGYEAELLTYLYSPLVSNWIPEIFRNVIYSDSTWDPTTFTLEDGYNGYLLNPANINTFDSDISAFRDRGGKILHWHGSADPLLSSSVSNLYYDNVKSTLNATVAELDEFYRYFRASGVYHCFGGPGANYLGQMGAIDASSNPEDNMLMRIVEWVENGAAPEFVRGTKFVNDTVELGVEFTRKHCKYPLVNKYKGTGNGMDEDGWECIEAST
jgi:feruloyl esterase